MQKEKLALNNIRERDPLTEAEKESATHALSQILFSHTGGRKIELDTTRALGAKDSAHDVFFVQTPVRDTDGKRAIFACKRFRDFEGAGREIDGMIEAQKRGFITPQQTQGGMFSIPDIGFVVVTDYIPRFTTMNYLGWRDHYAGQPNYERKLAKPLQAMGKYVGEMHSAGIIHGDLQAKNIARNGQGEFVLFDTEGTTFSSIDQMDDVDYISHAGKDLTVLIGSLVNRGYLWNSTDSIFESEIQANLLDPYMTAVADKGTISNASLIDYAQHGVEEAMMLRPMVHNGFSSRIGMPS
jgi:hypothetical protein